MKETARLHFIYTVSILIGLIILIATDRWTDKENFTVFLSNAATMTSLVLGLVAIFYSFISNDGLSRSLGNISKVSEDIGTTRSALTEVLEKSELLVSESKLSARELKEISLGLEKGISSLKDSMIEFKEQNTAMRESISNLPMRFDQLEAKISETNSGSNKAKDSDVSDDEVSRLAEACLRQSSLSGVFFVYAAILANRNEVEFSIPEYCKDVGDMNEQYGHGFLVAIHSSNFIDAATVKGKIRVNKISAVCGYFSNVSREKIEDLVKSKTKSYTADSQKKWFDKIKATEDFFKTTS